MRTLLTSFFLAAGLISFAGCSTDSSGVQGEPVATTQDEFEAYDKMMMETEAESAAEDTE